MTEKCKYHPKEQATWFCNGCKTNFCSGCVPAEEASSGYPKCTLCRRILVSLSIAKKIPPFWKKLSSLLSMPLTSGPMFVILLFSFIFALLPDGKVGALLVFICLVPVIEFMFDCMEQIASGEKLQIKMTNYLSLENKNNLFKLLLVYSLIVIFITKIHVISSTVSFSITAFFILGIPASIIILMMEKSMLAMINPVKIGYIIKLFGSAYWLLYGTVLLLTILIFNFNPLAQVDSINLLSSTLSYSFILYLMSAVFLMAGYLVYQYHFELNFTINRETSHNIEEKSKPEPMAEVNIFIQEGRYEDAQTALLKLIEANELDYKAYEKLILLYSIQGKEFFLNNLAQKYFLLLVHSNKNRHAADFISKLKERSIKFEPDSIEVMIGICGEMKNKNQYSYALELISVFIEQHGMVEQWEKLYFIHAQILAELSNKTHEAINILELIIKRSTNQNVLDKTDKYLNLLL